MRIVLLVLLLFSGVAVTAQEKININGVSCGIHGSSRTGTLDYRLNIYKNRHKFPGARDYDTTITLQVLEGSSDPNQFSFDKAVIIRGYVYNVKEGGVETCNCKSKAVKFRDTHIELIAVKNADSTPFRVIAEITPRMRQIMLAKGVDWSTGTLKKTIKGHYVELAGWLFYDAEHEMEAYANDPDNMIGRKNWRATCWEVHPITYLKITDGVYKPYRQTMAQQEQSDSPSSVQPAAENAVSKVWVAALLISLAIIIYFLLKK